MSFADYFDARASSFGAWYERGATARMLGRGAILDRMQFAIEVASTVRARTAIDVGCGTGASFAPLTSLGVSVTAIDPAPSMVARSRDAAAQLGDEVNIVQAGWEDLGRQPLDEQFDLALVLGVFDYVDEPVELLRSLHDHARHVAASFPTPGLRTMLRRTRYGRHGVTVVGYDADAIRSLARDSGYEVSAHRALGRAGSAIHLSTMT